MTKEELEEGEKEERVLDEEELEAPEQAEKVEEWKSFRNHEHS